MKTLNTLFTLLFFVCFSTMTFAQGDDCASAQSITLTSGTTVSLTGDGAATGAGCFNCSSGATNADWFTFNAPGTGIVDISVCADPDDPDTRLWVYDGACGTLNQVAADDDGCSGTFESTITGLQVCSGVDYYLEFDDRWTTSDYDFEITYTDNCPIAQNVAASLLALDSIGLTWDNTCSNVGNFTVEYGPTGFTQGTGTMMNTTMGMMTAAGLMSNTSYDFYIQDSCGVGNTSTVVGPFTFSTLNPCADPTNIMVAPNPTDATISYTSNQMVPTGLAQIAIHTAPFAVGAAPTQLTMTTNPYVITNLTQQTTYYYYVREICDPLGPTFSNWQGPFSFTTPLPPAFAPQAYDFEADPNGIAGNNTLAGGLSGTNTSNPAWTVDVGGTPSSGTGPSVDHTFGTPAGKYIFLETSSNPGTDYLTTPPIDMSTATEDSMSFWYHMYGATMGTLNVNISNDNGATFTNLWNQSGQVQTANADPWLQVVIDLSAYSGQSIIVQFEGIRGTSFTSDMALDDISIGGIPAPPTCFAPTSLAAFNLTGTSADISFAPGAGTTMMWDVEYGPAGFTPGSGTIVTVSTLPANLSGLMSATTYDAYVRDNCGGGDVSPWAGPVTFTTSAICNAINTFPYIENFDGITPTITSHFSCETTDELATECWDNDQINTNNWIPNDFITGSGQIGGDHTTGTTTYLYLESSSCGNNGPNHLITPELDFSAGLPDSMMTFWYYREPVASSGALEVSASTDGGMTWSAPLMSIPDGQGSDSWQKAFASIAAYDGMASVHLRISGTTGQNFSGDIAIDDVEIGVPAPSCAMPTGLTALSVGTNSATIGWTSGGSFLHNFILTPAGTGPAFSLLTLRGVMDEDADVNGILLPGTSYDVYVQDSCTDVGLVSAWAGPFTFTTVNPACFKVAPYTETFDSSATLDVCWTQDGSDDGDWRVDANGTPSSTTGPSGDTSSAAGTGNYMYMEASAPVAPGDEYILISPSVDISALTNPELAFYYHMFGTSVGDLEIWVEAPAFSDNWTFATSWTGNQGNAWTLGAQDLGPFVDSSDMTVRAAFLARRSTGWSGDIAIDQVSFQGGPACPAPFGAFVDNITMTDATINWVGSAATYDVEYGVEGFTPGSGTMITGVMGTSTPVTGLMTDVEYEYYITSDCGSAIGPFAFHTDCGMKPGDSFLDPIMVGSLPYADTNRTDRCYSNQFLNSHGYAAADVIYMVTTSANPCQSLTASMCGPLSTYDGFIYILDAAGNELAEGDDDCGTGGGPGEIVDFPTSPNTTYYVVVTGWSFSEGKYELAITENTRSVSVSATATNTTTAGGSDGSASISTDATAPYFVLWSNGSNMDTITGLMAGDYGVTVTDAFGCANSAMVTVADPCPADLGLQITQFQATGNGANDGGVFVTPTAGSAPYTYAWSNGGTSNTVDSLLNGTILTLTVTDANGCTTDTTVIMVNTSTNNIPGLNGFALYPNPTQDQTQLELSFDNSANVRVELVDVVGRVLHTELRDNVVETQFTFDVSNYSAGMYMIRVTADGQSMTRKLIISE